MKWDYHNNKQSKENHLLYAFYEDDLTQYTESSEGYFHYKLPEHHLYEVSVFRPPVLQEQHLLFLSQKDVISKYLLHCYHSTYWLIVATFAVKHYEVPPHCLLHPNNFSDDTHLHMELIVCV